MVAGNAPVAGSMGSWPDVMIRLPAWMPCEYGPMAAGAFSVEMTVFYVFRKLVLYKMSKGLYGGKSLVSCCNRNMAGCF